MIPAAELYSAKIMIVDDQSSNVQLLQRVLQLGGYPNTYGLSDPREIVALFGELQPDMILLDLHMPFMDGFAVLEVLRCHIPADAYLPIVVLSADITPESKRRALAAGARE